MALLEATLGGHLGRCNMSGGCVDIMINNAAVMIGTSRNFIDGPSKSTLAEWDETFRVFAEMEKKGDQLILSRCRSSETRGISGATGELFCQRGSACNRNSQFSSGVSILSLLLI